MKTIKYKNIGGVIIIDHFDNAVVDPESTRLSTIATLKKLSEYKKHAEKMQGKTAELRKVGELRGRIKQANDYIVNAEKHFDALEEKERPEVLAQIERARTAIASFSKKLAQHQKRADGCDPELEQLGNTLREKEKELQTKNAMYCHPRKNEVIPTPGQLEKCEILFKNRQRREQVKINVKFVEKVVHSDPVNGNIKAPLPELYGEPSIIADYTGCQYFWKTENDWKITDVITELGVVKEDVAPIDAIEKNDLTPEQLEEIRIQDLTAEQKDKEKQVYTDRILAESINMKTGLEIKGKSAKDALAESKTWYNEQLALIEAKYA
jgi:hypothetical protein